MVATRHHSTIQYHQCQHPHPHSIVSIVLILTASSSSTRHHNSTPTSLPSSSLPRLMLIRVCLGRWVRRRPQAPRRQARDHRPGGRSCLARCSLPRRRCRACRVHSDGLRLARACPSFTESRLRFLR
eukprot:2429544-Rhodomonas_salina.1